MLSYNYSHKSNTMVDQPIRFIAEGCAMRGHG